MEPGVVYLNNEPQFVVSRMDWEHRFSCFESRLMWVSVLDGVKLFNYEGESE